jgi:hypothetical protein
MTVTLTPRAERLLYEIAHGEPAEQVVERALETLAGKHVGAPAQTAVEARNLVELFAPVRGLLTDEEIDLLFTRNPSTTRPLDLS